MRIQLEITFRSVVRLVLALILLWAAASKLANLQAFYANLVAYQLPLPGVGLRLAAVVLPWMELFCGALLLAAGTHRAALGWCLLLFVLFAAATGQAWARGLDIHCGCLDLSWLHWGDPENSALVKFLESAPFAFFRSLALVAGVVYLLRSEPAIEFETAN
jgi:putative oxidoreductase